MPVNVKKDRNNKLRLYEAGTNRLARAKKKDGSFGAPHDGGGFPNTTLGRAKAGRQAGYINESVAKKRKR